MKTNRLLQISVLFLIVLWRAGSISVAQGVECQDFSGKYYWKTNPSNVVLEIVQTQCASAILNYSRSNDSLLVREFRMDGTFHVVSDGEDFSLRKLFEWSGKI